MFSSGLVFDNAAVVNYTGCTPFGPDGQHLSFAFCRCTYRPLPSRPNYNTKEGPLRAQISCGGHALSDPPHTNTHPSLFTTAWGENERNTCIFQ